MSEPTRRAKIQPSIRIELARLLAGREIWQRPGLLFAERMHLLRVLEIYSDVPPVPRCQWGAGTTSPCRREATHSWPLWEVWSSGDDSALELRCDTHEGATPCATVGCAGIAEFGWRDAESDLLSPAAEPSDLSTVWLCGDCAAGRGEPDALLRATQGLVP